jgi:hypothetical protein
LPVQLNLRSARLSFDTAVLLGSMHAVMTPFTRPSLVLLPCGPAALATAPMATASMAANTSM